ncbi:Proline-serine-threonine phosphatase-interacting protein 2 [Collichthys lucidus]|uniref:Proline-serine-threonine phosphatase-interacting protein 2 n=1 Tax=Collichthys lucidus TaxID=240159 RepID=A0A4U5VAZ8_COLLU|nr:Proline-serine-threonine phosphatase-interacting protein 2 [Collichthys lucidus]
MRQYKRRLALCPDCRVSDTVTERVYRPVEAAALLSTKVMKNLHFKDFFWNCDLTCTSGYDAIIQYLNDGKRTCKEVEEFMKARASIEEKYAKDLMGLSKKTKKTYEQKCRDKEEADQNVNRNTNNTKQLEKLNAKAQQAKQNAEEADRLYQQNVTTLGKARDEWMKEHVKACEMFEKQALERINFLRNTVWTHLNQLSQQCVTSDELYEEVRKSLEQCDVREDIEHFVNLRQTGDKPPAPVVYENFYSGQTGAPPSRLPPPIIR